MMPMPSEEFWHLIHHYDAGIFPIQYAFSILAIVLMVRVARKPSAALDRWMNLFLMACFVWIGTVFFLGFNAELSAQMRYFQPVLMFVVALLFGLDILLKKSHFRLPASRWHRGIVLTLLAYSIIGYPLVGWILGHPYVVEGPGHVSLWVPILGVYPCPTTVFGLALLGAAMPRGDKKVMIPLLYWSLSSIAGPPVRLYGVYEDIGLFLAGIYGLASFVKNLGRVTGQVCF